MKRKIDIDKRAQRFAIDAIKLTNQFPKTPAGFAIANQFSRSSMSIGANLVEAQDSVSIKEFVHKLSISLKEAKETLYWLEIIKETILLNVEVSRLVTECQELIKIIAKIIINTKKNN